jgi:hypothetical protein
MVTRVLEGVAPESKCNHLLINTFFPAAFMMNTCVFHSTGTFRWVNIPTIACAILSGESS